MSIHTVPKDALVKAIAEELKKISQMQPPVWTSIVKTGTNRQRPPVQKDWWYARAASVLKTVALLGTVGVSKLRTKYGGKKRRGHQPPEFRKASGKILRTILQQLEAAGLLSKETKKQHKGRTLSAKGHSFIDKVAKSLPKAKAPKQEAPAQKEAPQQKEQKTE